jgi:Methyltransferase domain
VGATPWFRFIDRSDSIVASLVTTRLDTQYKPARTFGTSTSLNSRVSVYSAGVTDRDVTDRDLTDGDLTDGDSAADLDTVLAEIRIAVAEKTVSGLYSEYLEDELRSHFARLLSRAQARDRSAALWAAIDQLGEIRDLPSSVVNASGLPGGTLVHRAAARLVSRHLWGLKAQFEAVNLALRSIAGMLDDPEGHTHDDLVHELDTLQDRVVAVENLFGRAEGLLDAIEAAAAPSLAELESKARLTSRMDDVEARVHRFEFTPTYSSIAFDAVSRGDRGEVRDEYQPVADQLVGVPGPVLDIGAGRGEVLDLLRDRHVPAWGVELDDELVAAASAQGLDVRLQDGLEALRVAAPGSLGAVTLIHVIEHLQPNELLEIASEAHKKLATGGKLVMETPNAQSLYIYARAFWLDPTHVRPVHPVYLEFVLRSAGFDTLDNGDDALEFEWTGMPAEGERLLEIPGEDPSIQAMNENVRRINQLVFAAQNYRVTATR